MKRLLYFFLLIVFGACGVGSQDQEIKTTTGLNMNNPSVQEIFDLQDKRNVKDLLIYFNHVDAQYRYAAAMAFASIQDTSVAAISGLTELLEDEDEAVRFAVVYALGQTNHKSAVSSLLKAFKNDRATGSNRINAMVLEGIGKCGTEQELNYLVKPANYSKRDTLILEGQSYGIYRYALRGIISESGTNKMLSYVSDPQIPTSVRRIAANYLGRVKDVDMSPHLSKITETLNNEPDAYVRMALVLALGKVEEDKDKVKALTEYASREKDYRVLVNIMRLLEKVEYPKYYVDTKPVYMSALNNKNRQLQVMGAEHFRINGARADVDLYRDMGEDSTFTADDWEKRILLLGAALANISYTRSGTRTKINERLIGIFNDSKNPYEKGRVLEVLAAFPMNYDILGKEAFNEDNHPYVRTAAMQGLADINKNPKLALTFGPDYDFISRFLKDKMEAAINSGDVALMAVASEVLRSPKLDYKYIYESDYSFIVKAISGLKLPKETETKYELEKTLAYFKGEETAKSATPKYNHEIDWSVYKNMTNETFARVKTKKGDIIIKFFAAEAPGSVANFVGLAKDNFYNKKAFHRVVQNFVIQGGCPRGDGWGGLDYTVRSELSDLKYDGEGYVGMASAGKDTECTQWFITHSPTPHLDGKYTIFGKVIDGMNIVHQIELGDVIEKITIETPSPTVEE